MEKTDNMPIWVYLAFSSITKRTSALLLIYSCMAFSVYCVPWGLLFPDRKWAVQIFLIDDWSWMPIMVPMTLWYWLSLRWIDKNIGWAASTRH